MYQGTAQTLILRQTSRESHPTAGPEERQPREHGPDSPGRETSQGRREPAAPHPTTGPSGNFHTPPRGLRSAGPWFPRGPSTGSRGRAGPSLPSPPPPVSAPGGGRRERTGGYVPGAHGEASPAALRRPQAGGGAAPGLQRGGPGGSAASCPAAIAAAAGARSPFTRKLNRRLPEPGPGPGPALQAPSGGCRGSGAGFVRSGRGGAGPGEAALSQPAGEAAAQPQVICPHRPRGGAGFGDCPTRRQAVGRRRGGGARIG